MSLLRIILGLVIVTIISIFLLIDWHKNIDSNTTWIYGIYILLHIILLLFVLIILEQFYLNY